MAGEYLGRGVVAYVGTHEFTGHQLQGLFLVEYDQGTDSYTGVSFPQNEKFTQFFASLGKGTFGAETPVNVGVCLRIQGLRRYPYAERPDYAFQFVLPGEDPAPLLAIMTQNAAAPPAEVVTESGEASDNQPTWQRLGFKNEEKWVKAGSPME